MIGWCTIAGWMLNHLKLLNNGRCHLSWRWWLWAISSTNLLKVMLLHWSKIFGSVPICTADEDDGDEDVDCYMTGILSPMVPLVSRVSGTGRCRPSWLPTTLTSFCPSIQVMLLCQVDTTRQQHRSFLHIKHEQPLVWPWHHFEVEGCVNLNEDCWWTCARDQVMLQWWQTTLGGTVSWTLWRKGNCEALTSKYCLEAELKR